MIEKKKIKSLLLYATGMVLLGGRVGHETRVVWVNGEVL